MATVLRVQPTGGYCLHFAGMVILRSCHLWMAQGNFGYLGWDGVYNTRAVRPVTSLKSCVLWKSGDGSPEKPYEIEETESGC